MFICLQLRTYVNRLFTIYQQFVNSYINKIMLTSFGFQIVPRGTIWNRRNEKNEKNKRVNFDYPAMLKSPGQFE